MNFPCSDCLQRDSWSFPCAAAAEQHQVVTGDPMKGMQELRQLKTNPGQLRQRKSRNNFKDLSTLLQAWSCFFHDGWKKGAVTELAVVLVKFMCFPLFFNCSTFSTCSINAFFFFFSNCCYFCSSVKYRKYSTCQSEIFKAKLYMHIFLLASHSDLLADGARSKQQAVSV